MTPYEAVSDLLIDNSIIYVYICSVYFVFVNILWREQMNWKKQVIVDSRHTN